MLQAFLDWHRATLLSKCAGLTAEELAERAVSPSDLSLLGLIRHLTEVERAWFRRRFAGERIDLPFAGDPAGRVRGPDPAGPTPTTPGSPRSHVPDRPWPTPP